MQSKKSKDRDRDVKYSYILSCPGATNTYEQCTTRCLIMLNEERKQHEQIFLFHQAALLLSLP